MFLYSRTSPVNSICAQKVLIHWAEYVGIAEERPNAGNIISVSENKGLQCQTSKKRSYWLGLQSKHELGDKVIWS